MTRTMNRDLALEILRRVRSALEARGIRHAGVFGSVARNEAAPTSDVDVVVTPGRRMDVIDLGGVQTLLERAFDGFAVDVVVAPVRKPDLAKAIERDKADAF
jgi:predicted nucleotidyltransferase